MFIVQFQTIFHSQSGKEIFSPEIFDRGIFVSPGLGRLGLVRSEEDTRESNPKIKGNKLNDWRTMTFSPTEQVCLFFNIAVGDKTCPKRLVKKLLDVTKNSQQA